MISAEELAAARTEHERWMPDTLQVRTYTPTSDNAGGFTTVPSDGPAISCRVAPVSSEATQEQELAGRLGLVEGWIVSVPHGTALAENQDIVINGTRVLQVASVLAPRSYEQYVRVLCREAG